MKPPALQTGAGDDQPPSATDVPAPAVAPDAAPDAAPTPVAVDPKTGLPMTAAEQREKEIDKYDPMKRATDSAAPDANPLTDRKQPEAADQQKSKSQSQSSSGGASGAATGASGQSGDKSAQGSAQDPTADDTSEVTGAEYSGPAVLSRSYTLARPMVPQQIKWRATVGFSYSFYDGEAPTLVDGVTGSQSTSGELAGALWSLDGRHVWRHDQLGLSYDGNSSTSNGNSSTYGGPGLAGTNNSLNLDYSHVISRRMSLQVVESLQDLSQNYSLQNPVLESSTTSLANINLATSPSVQLLNSTTRQSSSTASMTYRQTSRISYNLSGSYFIIGRTQGVGMTGRQAGADMNYRWTKRATIGAYYSYTDYLFSHNVSSSDSHDVGLIFSYDLSRGLQLQTRLGATRIESLGYEAVPLPPQLVAILGEGSTIVNAYSLLWTSDISVQLVKDFRRSRTGTLAYVHGQSPGNGVLLTSIQQSITAGYSMQLFRRRVPFSVGAIYSALDSTGQSNLGYFKSETGYMSTSRQLGRDVNGTLAFNYIRYDVSGSPLLQHTMSISLALVWGLPANLLRF